MLVGHALARGIGAPSLTSTCKSSQARPQNGQATLFISDLDGVAYELAKEGGRCFIAPIQAADKREDARR